MKLTIKGSIADSNVDLEVELSDADFANALAMIKKANVDIHSKPKSPIASVPKTEPETPLIKSRPEAKSSELALSLEYIKAKHEVTQYQLIDHLADEGHRDANIKRAIMWLKHHADIKVDTVSKGEHSQYFVFRWIAEP